MMDNLQAALAATLNSHSVENASDTPDFVLADFLSQVLDAYAATVRRRDEWFGGRLDRPPGRTVDGGVPGTVVTCPTCDGDGVLHDPDVLPPLSTPENHASTAGSDTEGAA